MKKGLLLLCLSMWILVLAHAQSELDYFLPERVELNPEIPSPAQILGFQIGDKHVSHDELIRYMHTLSSASNRIRIETYGYTHEGRPLLLLTISDPANLENIEQIRLNHLRLSDPGLSSNIDLDEQPVVIWMGYSVHGNEPSGLNASLLVAYYLAANQSEEMKNLLKKTIILLDPSINPDGYSRFSQWVNQFKSNVTISDPNNLEHNEPWPGGRTNHYWVDLNRDWLLLQQPESKARLSRFHQWLPNILTDHHEMGSDGTFFFQPGIPSRNNPNTPEETFLLTDKISTYHAAALDRIGSLYYARETFDDFYYGKGSTYPDINGGIGILFEQASSRGHARQTNHGVLTFPFTIRNQFTTSLSTLEAGNQLRVDLLKHQRDFYIQAEKEAGDDPVKAYLVDAQDDPVKLFHFSKILEQHQIDLFQLKENLVINGHLYDQGNTLVIPTFQKQYKLIRNLFEKTVNFQDSLFYDVSAWTLPSAFDLLYDELNEKQLRSLQLNPYKPEAAFPAGKLRGESSYGYLIRWDQYNSPMALYYLQEKGINVYSAGKRFTAADGNYFKEGTLFIPVQNQSIQENTLKYYLSDISVTAGIDIYPVSSGYTTEGIDLGSPNMESLKKPRILLLVGDGVSSYEAGEIWHLLDIRYRIPVTLVSLEQFNSINLNDYNKIIMVNGGYNPIGDQKKEDLKKWLENGGQIIAIKGGAKWLANQQMAFIVFRQPVSDSIEQKKYEDLDKDRGAQAIGGSIFKTRIDLTHPLCYGYPDEEVCIFKDGKYFFERSKNPYNNPVVYEKEPLVSGYISRINYEKIKNASAVVVSSIGRGKTICFSDDPNFRDFWFGTNRLFFNALFLGDLIRSDSAR
jgi:hypothetical protein